VLRIDHLTAEEGHRLRAIRLRSLQDAPDAFGSTFEELLARPLDDWSQQLRDLTTFVAHDEGGDIGLVRCVRDDRELDTAWLISMWVAPERRRMGVGGRLVEAVASWARSQGLTRVVLDVADHNASAIALYAARGFTRNGHTSTMPPPREHIREHQRELILR
jgi:GNAT superfamily N-acetyltransferase